MAQMQLLKTLSIDFMGWRRPAVIASAIVSLLFIGSMVIQGFNFGLDFTGGTIIEVGYERPAELSEIRDALDEGGFSGAIVQHFGSQRDVIIRLPLKEGQEASAQLSNMVFQALNATSEGAIDLRRAEFVGPQVGEELREDGGLATLFALIGILIYVAVRFEWRFAVGAVVATIHDVIFTIGVFSLLQIEFNLSVLAAVLAVIGYSVNDTVVIYDRVRENFRRMRKGTVIDIVNRSINETLSRTIITGGTTLLVVFALYIFGGEVLKGFSLALIIGIIIGTYSSIYVATAAVVWLGISKTDLIPPPKEKTEAEVRP